MCALSMPLCPLIFLRGPEEGIGCHEGGLGGPGECLWNAFNIGSPDGALHVLGEHVGVLGGPLHVLLPT